VFGLQLHPKIQRTNYLVVGFPVMLFVLCGYEHVVANMFFFPMGAVLDSSITLTQIMGNIIPVTQETL
jgi:formate/nitrite transporter FocA (FNT family)